MGTVPDEPGAVPPPDAGFVSSAIDTSSAFPDSSGPAGRVSDSCLSSPKSSSSVI
jgi:hypothetical protein